MPEQQLPAPGEAASSAAADMAALRQRLALLAQRGAARRSPVDFALAAALCERLPSPSPALDGLLMARALAAVQACDSALAQRRPTRAAVTGRAPSPLQRLNADLAQRHPPAAGTLPELASAARFRAAWDRQRAQDRIEQAQARRPTQAGPLNSHAIALECLTLMQSLAPAYLRQFLLQVEALQQLEQWQAELLAVPAQAAGDKPRPAKARSGPGGGRTGPGRKNR